MLPSKLEEDFFAGRRSAELPYCESDAVTVLSGPYAGRHGTVVLLDRGKDAPRFLVDFNDGTDELFFATALSADHRAA